MESFTKMYVLWDATIRFLKYLFQFFLYKNEYYAPLHHCYYEDVRRITISDDGRPQRGRIRRGGPR